MVELNKQQGEIIITMKGDASTLVNTQIALIQLMKNFGFSGMNAEGPFFWVLNLLEELLPEEEQQERALEDGKFIRLPESMTEIQRVRIREAFNLIEDDPTGSGTNMVFQALKKVG